MMSWNTVFSTERREEERGREGGGRQGELLAISIQLVLLPSWPPLVCRSARKGRTDPGGKVIQPTLGQSRER